MATSQPSSGENRARRSFIWVLLALLPLVLLRRQLGYRLVHPGRLLLASTLVVVLPLAFNLYFNERLNTLLLLAFAALVFVMGMRHRIAHARELAAGGSAVHTLQTGLPHIVRMLPALPLWMAACIIDPVVCAGAGYLTLYLCTPIGLTAILCAVALLVVDGTAYAAQRRHFLDAHDSINEAGRHGRMAEHHARRPPHQGRAQSTGTPAGVADDLEWHFARRQD